MWFTLKYTVVVTVLLFALSFGLALIVQHPCRGVALLRTAFFLPAAVGFASASLLFLGCSATRSARSAASSSVC